MFGSFAVTNYLYLDKNKKFKISARQNEATLFNWFKAHWYWMLWNLPPWLYRNAKMFAYPLTRGVVFLCKKKP